MRPSCSELYRPALGNAGSESRSVDTILLCDEQRRTAIRHQAVKAPVLWSSFSVNPAAVLWAKVTSVVTAFEDEMFLIPRSIGPFGERDKLVPLVGNRGALPIQAGTYSISTTAPNTAPDTIKA
jgi:hypothetical protein